MTIQETTVSKSYNKANEDIPLGKITSPPASKKKNRKGGLSMFLSGALDDIPKITPPPPVVVAKSEGPAWGGAKAARGSTSLRVIQDEQSKIETKPTIKKEADDYSEVGIAGKLPLSSFICSSPIAVGPNWKAQTPDGDINTPPWAASGTPPSLSRPSLRDIQFQQVCFLLCFQFIFRTRIRFQICKQCGR